MFLKQLVHDSYMVRYNKDYYGVKEINEKQSDSMAREKKKKSVTIDEETDKKGFSDGGKNSKKEGGSEDFYTEQ